MIVKEFKNVRKGFYLIKGKVKSEKPICDAKIKIFYNGQEKVIKLPLSLGGNINYIIKLEKNSKILRIEVPISENGREEREITIRRIFFLERIYRYYRRVLPVLFSRNDITKSLKKFAGLSLFDIIFIPEKSYYRVSYARYRRICFYKNYSEWLREYIEKEKEYLSKIKKTSGKISFLIFVLQRIGNPELMKKTLDSINSQIYKNYNIIVLKNRNFGKFLSKYSADYILFVEEGDILNKACLFCFSEHIARNNKPDIVYSDNDYINPRGERVEPQLKPDWSPDYFTEFDYIQFPVAFKKEILFSLEIDEFFTNYEIIIDALKKIKNLKITHIPAILYTRSRKETQEELNRKYDKLKEFLKDKADVNRTKFPRVFKVSYRVENFPKVSIIIPTKDRANILKDCIESIIQKTNYDNFEIIIIDNGSREKAVYEFYEKLKKFENIKILKKDIPFNFSKLINFGVANAKGEVICLLNNDTKVVDKNWLKELVSHAVRKEVGVVGTKLLYPNNTIQHGGVIMGIFKGVDHAFKGLKGDVVGYMFKLITLQNYLAVTAACMLFRKEVFNEVGGFDENFAVNFNDVDFCLRVYEKGYRIVFDPHTFLYHLESKTRKIDENVAKKEKELLYKRWKKYIERDPYYNPNLTPFGTNFALNPEIKFYCNE